MGHASTPTPPRFPVGAVGLAEPNKEKWGRSGYLTAQLPYVSVNGRQKRMNGTFNDKGVTGTAGVVGAAVLIPVEGTTTRETDGCAMDGSAKKPRASI